MLLQSEAYGSCINYLADHLNIFEGKKGAVEGTVIAELVKDKTADMLIDFCDQQEHLSNHARLEVIAEGDDIVRDIEQVLGKCWHYKATEAQYAFLEEYFLILKNSLDSQVPVINGIQES